MHLVSKVIIIFSAFFFSNGSIYLFIYLFIFWLLIVTCIQYIITHGQLWFILLLFLDTIIGTTAEEHISFHIKLCKVCLSDFPHEQKKKKKK